MGSGSASASAAAPAGSSGDSWAVGVAVGLVGAGFFKVVLVSLNQLLKLLFGNLFLF